jgi:hypothetical protein
MNCTSDPHVLCPKHQGRNKFQKLVNIVNLEDEQQGFRRGRSCTDAIFVVRQLADKAMEFNRHFFFCFIDIEKAFDKIRLKHVLNILKSQDMPTGIINLIRDIYTNNYTRIKIEGVMGYAGDKAVNWDFSSILFILYYTVILLA